MFPRLKNSVVLVLLVALAACAQVNSFNKQAVVANTAVESAATLTSTLSGAGKITQEDARQIYVKLVDVRKAIESARVVHKASAQEGSDKLSIAMAALAEINKFLEAKQ